MMKSFEDANKVGKDVIDHSFKSFAAMSKGIQAITSEATDYSMKSYEEGIAAFEKLAGAKSLDKAVEVQTEYMKSAYETFITEATKMGELYADLAKEVYKPFEAVFPSTAK